MDAIFYLNWLIVVVSIILILFRKPSEIKRIIYPIYFAFLIITFLSYLSVLLGINIGIFEVLGSLWTYTAFAIVILHSSLFLGRKKSLIFFIIALFFGLFSELALIKYGWVGAYYYNPVLSPFIFGVVPVMTVVSWATIIYISYTFANMILEGFGSAKPNIKQNKLFMIIILILLSAISGLVAANLDMLLDPVVVATHGWIWVNGGPYFGVPLGNFVGWFVITFVATLVYRLYELFQKATDGSLPKKSFFTISSIIILYLMYFVIYGLSAFRMGNQVYILIGATTMGPFILITTLFTVLNFFGKNKKK
jgi:uncharacterized membrane protein